MLNLQYIWFSFTNQMKLKKIVLILSGILLLLSFNKSEAQDIITEKNFISLGVLGTSSYIGVTYERMLTDEWAAEIGVGVLSVGFGATYYPWKIKEGDISFYTGMKYSSPNVITAIILIPDQTDAALYVPIGFTYATSGGFSLGLDVGPNIIGTSGVWGGIRAGFRF